MPVSHCKRKRCRSGAYAEQEQREPIVLSYLQNLLCAAEPRRVFMGSNNVTSAMLAAIFVFDHVTTSTAHLYLIDLIDNINMLK